MISKWTGKKGILTSIISHFIIEIFCGIKKLTKERQFATELVILSKNKEISDSSTVCE